MQWTSGRAPFRSVRGSVRIGIFPAQALGIWILTYYDRGAHLLFSLYTLVYNWTYPKAHDQIDWKLQT